MLLLISFAHILNKIFNFTRKLVHCTNWPNRTMPFIQFSLPFGVGLPNSRLIRWYTQTMWINSFNIVRTQNCWAYRTKCALYASELRYIWISLWPSTSVYGQASVYILEHGWPYVSPVLCECGFCWLLYCFVFFCVCHHSLSLSLLHSLSLYLYLLLWVCLRAKMICWLLLPANSHKWQGHRYDKIHCSNITHIHLPCINWYAANWSVHRFDLIYAIIRNIHITISYSFMWCLP